MRIGSRSTSMCPERPAPSRRGGVCWVTVWLTTLALIAAACSDGSGADSDTAAQASATTGAALQPLEQPSSRCGAPATKATLVRFKAADGTSLDGVLVGSGPAGVVLAHEYPADLCGAWPFADYLSKRGLRAFAIDLRCFGRSACPEGEAKGRVVEDLDAAAAELRRRGVTRVALVGASMGGAAVLIAGTRVQPPVAAVVSLSAETDPTSLVVATNDRYVSVEE